MWNYTPSPTTRLRDPPELSLIYSATSRKAPHPHQKPLEAADDELGALDLLIPCNSSFLPLQIASAPGTLSGERQRAKLTLSLPQSSFHCNQGIQYVTLFNTMYVSHREQIWKYMSWQLYQNGSYCVFVFSTQGQLNTVPYRPVLSASTTDLNEIH